MMHSPSSSARDDTADARGSGTRLRRLRRSDESRVQVVTDDDSLFEEVERVATARGITATWLDVEDVPERADVDRLDEVLVVDLESPWMVPDWLRERLRSPGRTLVVAGLGADPQIFQFHRSDLQTAFDRVEAMLLHRAVDLDAILLGRSEAMRQLKQRIRDVAPFRHVSVLVIGETGTGKEHVAHAIHRLSPGRGRMVAINCAAVPETLFESELFGHGAGAYTGSRGEREGLLETARHGTLFFDEVGEMPQALQPKILRAIETRSFRPVGTNEERSFEARIVSATNRDPLRDGTLRRDLYYRLAGFTLAIPPLRRRPEDILDLAPAFLRDFTVRHGLTVQGFEDGALEVLMGHRWPGNVRELRAAIEHAAILASGPTLGVRQIRQSVDLVAGEHAARRSSAPPPRRSSRPAARITPAAGSGLRDVERQIILRTLRKNDGNVAKTARELEIPRSTLRAKLRRYGEC
ncbi:MAG TPA: sigma 54-interacting transcriptional regulator [Sandaracinaceae bacterium LLY-WYZ-13_1]|nr:sigma 54-interacting transcriptional regulator [Sandaracinaceae bacterium LLY-WYZ-13_1]